ncbi:hypothetical protein ABE587_03870 [[Pseudomonas] hibiscicola]|uniref:Uncharacterized protein n=1 Tax=Stenotrophomonas hibiscicola TaxID=86189 RepID=A0ABV0C3L2_9GAMM
MKEQERAVEALARQMERNVPIVPINDVRQKREAAARAARPKQLPAGHRCINGQTFRRVENGWVQVSSTCTP